MKSKKLKELYSVMKDFVEDGAGYYYMSYFGDEYIISIERYGRGYLIYLTNENDEYIVIGNDDCGGVYIGEHIPFSTLKEAKEKLKMLSPDNRNLMQEIKEAFKQKTKK